MRRPSTRRRRESRRSSRLRLEQQLGQLQRHRRAGSGRAHHGVPAGLDPEGLTLDKSGTTVLSPDGRWVVVSKPTTTLRTANQSCGARISAVLKQIGRPHTQTVVRTQMHEGPSPWPRGQREGLSSETFEPLEAVVLLPVEVVLVGIDFCVHLDFSKRRSFPGHHSHPLVGMIQQQIGSLWPRS